MLVNHQVPVRLSIASLMGIASVLAAFSKAASARSRLSSSTS